MSADKRFYGIYSAIVADSEDPESLGRVKLIIPQVLGNNITEWCYGIGGNSLPNTGYPYGTFITNASQTVTAANTETIAIHWQEEDVNRMYLSDNKIYAQETGDYLLVWSALLNKDSASNAEFDIWVKVNGQPLSNSNTRGHLSGSDAETVVAASSILDLEAGDYFEVAFSSDSSQTRLQYYPVGAGPVRPAVPGLIVTVNLVGKWKPQAGTKAWAMFEAGDPNFPVWIGGLQ